MALYVVSDTETNTPILVHAASRDSAHSKATQSAIASIKARFNVLRVATVADGVTAGREQWPTIGIDDEPQPPDCTRQERNEDWPGMTSEEFSARAGDAA